MSRIGRAKRQKESKPGDGNESGAVGGSVAPELENTCFLGLLQKNAGNDDLDDMTAWEIFTRHPLVRVGKFVLVPYLLYWGWFYFQLQHPEYVSTMTGGIVSLRPAVHNTTTPRQLLIVATPGSGTVQISSELRRKLSLEIGHESADAAWEFNRDGTVSWFHGIRFLLPPKDDNERVRSLAKICDSDMGTHSNMGFHPAMYGPPRNGCSYRKKWGECWKAECYVRLLREWGCSITKSCEINFTKNIHQVRNPLKTLESLVAKYCIAGVDGVMAEPFLTYASALFPGHDFYADSCIEASGMFMVSYLEAMMEARSRGNIDEFYRIEDSSVCDIAEVAGLLSPNTTVYDLNHVRIKSICDKSDENSPARRNIPQELNKVNKDRLRLGWKDLRGGMHGSKRKDGDRALERKVKNMFMAFMYDKTTVPLQYDPSDDGGEL